MKKIIAVLLIIVALFSVSLKAQEKESTLFKYPQVPDTISTLENRSNYFVSSFWEKCDLSKPIKDGEKLKSAFADYVVFFQYAHKNIVKTSVNNLMNKAQSNMKNFWTLIDAAEHELYSDQASLPSDEAYILFIENILRSSKVKKAEKERYKAQLEKINKNQIGVIAPMFDFIDVNGEKKSLDSVKGETIIMFFNDPECDDCSISRLRLSTNVAINNLIDAGKLAIVSIYPGKYSKEWAENAKTYSDKWTIGAYEEIDQLYDLRNMPAIYVLDSDFKIVNKHISVVNILNAIGR